MKNRRYILILEILTILVVVAIFVWQFLTLPSLRFQINAGLHSSLQKIGREAAEGYNDFYLAEAKKGNQLFRRRVPAGLFSEKYLEKLKPTMKIIAGSHPMSSVWLIMFVGEGADDLRTFEYKPPGQYRPEAYLTGSWEPETELARQAEEQTGRLISEYDSIQAFSRQYFANNVDSTLIFLHNPDFSNNLLIGMPVFDEKDASLKGFIFNLTNNTFFENDLTPYFFNDVFWTDGKEKEGIEKKFIQFGVMTGQGNQMIYNSIAFGSKNFEHVISLSSLNSFLPHLRIGVKFRNTTVEEVGNSIYNRNLILLGSLLAAMIVLLFFIFRMIRKANRLSAMKSDFIANVSHEIKTPLASIRLANDSLKLGRIQTDEQRMRVTDIIGREVVRLQYLVNTILDFSKIESGRKQYRMRKLRVNELAQALISAAEVKINQAEFSLEAENLAGQGQVQADPMALEQVVMILVDNAIKYSGGNQHIHIQAERTNKAFTFSITDSGIGIAKDQVNIIFDKFVRITDGDVHDVKGYGIGLSIAMTIIKDHDGDIKVVSSPGKGSTFTIVLPIVNE